MAQTSDPPAEGVPKGAEKGAEKGKAAATKEEELSDEDLKLKEGLEEMVARLADPSAVAAAIESVGKEIRTSTTSMTSVPKPLKFLRPHFEAMKAAYAAAPAACQPTFADVLSVLATVSGKEDEREALRFRLLGTGCDPGSWGHEYMRHMAGEVAAEYHNRSAASESVEQLMALVKVRDENLGLRVECAHAACARAAWLPTCLQPPSHSSAHPALGPRSKSCRTTCGTTARQRPWTCCSRWTTWRRCWSTWTTRTVRAPRSTSPLPPRSYQSPTTRLFSPPPSQPT